MARKNTKEKLVSLHIAMFINESETPFLSLQNLCFYVLNIILPNGFNKKKGCQLRQPF